MVGHGDARELTQEVFLRVARGPIPQADDPGRRAWIFSIARNLALNHVRDDRRRGVAVELSDASSPPVQELAAALREALDRLAPSIATFPDAEAGGLRYDEIALACELSVDGVRSRLHRARQQLRAVLSPALSRHHARGVKLYDRARKRSTRPVRRRVRGRRSVAGRRACRRPGLKDALADRRHASTSSISMPSGSGRLDGTGRMECGRTQRRARTREMVCRGRAVVMSLAAGYVAGQRVTRRPPSRRPRIEAAIQFERPPAAPTPTQVIPLRPGINWTEDSGGR